MTNAPSAKSHTARYVAIALGVVIVVILAVLLGMGIGATNQSSQTPNQSPPSPTTSTIVSSGTVYPINTGEYEHIQFTLNSYATISGSFSATNSITVYIMSPSEFANFSSSGSASGYYYTTGQVSSGGINTNLNAGTYYLVFQNTNLITTTSVTITQDIVSTS